MNTHLLSILFTITGIIGSTFTSIAKWWMEQKDKAQEELFQRAENGTLTQWGIVFSLLRGTDVEAKNDNGLTALMLASSKGHLEIVRLLIEAGANVNAKRDDWTALMSASRNGHAQVVRLLVDAGADVNTKGSDGWTPLMLASWEGHLEVVRLLVDAGADVNTKGSDGWTALMWASLKGHLEVVRLL